MAANQEIYLRIAFEAILKWERMQRRLSMLVLSREVNRSVIVGCAEETCVVTVLRVCVEERKAALLMSRAWAGSPGKLEVRSVVAQVDQVIAIGDHADIRLVDVRQEKARIGICAPNGWWADRLEDFEALRQAEPERGEDDDPEEGNAGSPAPRPSPPKPPSLDVKKDEPASGDEG